MKYTQEHLEVMSDRQIDALIAEKKLGMSTNKDIQRLFAKGKLNYCNSWADMGPIIPSISEDLFSRPEWCLFNRNLWDYFTDLSDGNMCRSAAIVYLLMGE